MIKDLRQWSWEHDIERFARHKRTFEATKYQRVRELTHKWMCEIQASWPQFIKITEIPDL